MTKVVRHQPGLDMLLALHLKVLELSSTRSNNSSAAFSTTLVSGSTASSRSRRKMGGKAHKLGCKAHNVHKGRGAGKTAAEKRLLEDAAVANCQQRSDQGELGPYPT
jgi:hypothetical protein